MSLGITLALQGLAGLLVAALPVRVEPTSGAAFDGVIQSVDETSVSIERNGQSERIAFDDLASFVPQSLKSSSGPATRVVLWDGSQIAAEEVTLENDELRVAPHRQEPLNVPVRRAAAIRFRAPAPTTDPRWLGIREQQPRGDLLVVRRDGGKLDPVSVVVEEIADGQVHFILGDDTASAPIERLEGIVFGGEGDEDPPDAAATIADIHGSQWVIDRWLPGPVEDEIEIGLRGGMNHSIPIDQLASIRFRSGLLSLVEQPPAEQDFRPYLESQMDRELLEGWFGPRIDAESDVQMLGGSSVTYRVEPGFSKFLGSVRRDPRVAVAGEVIVRIRFDDRVVWEQSLRDAEVQGFELPLEKAARIQIEVDTGSDGDVGDQVRVLRPRLVK